MKKKVISVCWLIFFSTFAACGIVSLSSMTPTPMISSVTSISTQSNVSTPSDPSAKATFDSIRASIVEEQESGMQLGNEIIAAIEKYYLEKSHYPGNLAELVPSYLDEIPLTITGEQFEYRLIEPQLYYLSFLLGRQAERFACTYMGDLKTWECSGTGH